MSTFNPGDYVLIRARVQQIYHADRGPEWETYSLILGDGQNLQTNVRNLRAEAKEDDDEGKPAAKAMTRPPATKAFAGPAETKAEGEEVAPPPDQTRDPAPDAKRARGKTDG